MSKPPSRRRYSRRGFLGVAGAGAAGALTAGAAGRLGMEEAHAAPPAPSRSDRFGRMFPDLAPFAESSPALIAALNAMGAKDGPIDARDDVRMTGGPGPLGLILNPGRNEDSRLPAGTTFLGQFVDHDITFDERSQLGVPTTPETSPNSRQPTLNLDSVYGSGFGNSTLVLPDGSMKIENVAGPGSPEDLPRMADGSAVIGDRRNDENVMIAGIHAAFLRFHNRALGTVGGSDPATRFAEARRLTTWHYQWIVLHQLLPALVGQKLVDHVLRHGRRFYRPSGEPFIPVEFQIAYRLHTLVRPSYRLNFTTGPANGPLILFLFHPSQDGVADPDDLRGGQRSPRRFVDWQTFFPFPGFEAAMRNTKKIDRLVSTPLFTLPMGAIATGDPPTVLAQRNLLRHVTWGLPSGQAIARAMGEHALGGHDLRELREFGQGLERSTPLWHYVNAEGELLGGGERLGPVGGRIVAEVLIGLLQLDPGVPLAARLAADAPGAVRRRRQLLHERFPRLRRSRPRGPGILTAVTEFLLELYVSRRDVAAVERGEERARVAADGLTREGTPVRYLRSIFIPEDETCFYLYEAASVNDVREAARRAQLPFERIAEAM